MLSFRDRTLSALTARPSSSSVPTCQLFPIKSILFVKLIKVEKRDKIDSFVQTNVLPTVHFKTFYAFLHWHKNDSLHCIKATSNFPESKNFRTFKLSLAKFSKFEQTLLVSIVIFFNTLYYATPQKIFVCTTSTEFILKVFAFQLLGANYKGIQ
jgi:hypothetical protein